MSARGIGVKAMSVKTAEGLVDRGRQAASGSRTRRGSGFSPRASSGNAAADTSVLAQRDPCQPSLPQTCGLTHLLLFKATEWVGICYGSCGKPIRPSKSKRAKSEKRVTAPLSLLKEYAFH